MAAARHLYHTMIVIIIVMVVVVGGPPGRRVCRAAGLPSCVQPWMAAAMGSMRLYAAVLIANATQLPHVHNPCACAACASLAPRAGCSAHSLACSACRARPKPSLSHRPGLSFISMIWPAACARIICHACICLASPACRCLLMMTLRCMHLPRPSSLIPATLTQRASHAPLKPVD